MHTHLFCFIDFSIEANLAGVVSGCVWRESSVSNVSVFLPIVSPLLFIPLKIRSRTKQGAAQLRLLSERRRQGRKGRGDGMGWREKRNACEYMARKSIENM